jgi:hypothetical protein
MGPDLSNLQRPELLDVLELWKRGQNGREMPVVGSLSPVDVAPYIGHVVIVEVEAETDRIRIMQVGGELRSIYGDGLEGQYLDRLPKALRGHVEDTYRSMVGECRPKYAEFEVSGDSWRVIVERLMLPFREEETGRVSGAMVVIYPRISISKRATQAPEALAVAS